MITRIRIKRLRGIKEGELRDLKQFTVLIGRNGSGKSSVLEAVYLASASVNLLDPLRDDANKLGYVISRRGGTPGAAQTTSFGTTWILQSLLRLRAWRDTQNRRERLKQSLKVVLDTSEALNPK